jgi:prepilin-type N-terminal cleavage/methylation domain-containing protein
VVERMNAMTGTHGRRPARGFSLLELMIVVGITLVVAAIAIPSIATAVYNVRLRAGASSVSGLIQTGRMMAVKKNRTYKVRFSTVGSSALAYVDLNDDGSPQATEPQVQTGGTVVKSAAPTGTAPPPLDSTYLGQNPATGDPDPYFDSRGIPHPVGSTTTLWLAYYFTDNRPVSTPGWAAITISPAGRVKTWFWTGSAWAD